MRAAWLGRVAVLGAMAGTAACTSGRTMETASGEVVPASSGVMVMTTAMLFADPHIAAVGSASNQEEIQTSRLALERAADPRVKAFAQRMIDEHTRVEQQMAQLAQAKGMAPMDNALSLQMKRNLPPKLEMLRGMSGREFDMGYMMRQVHAHEMTLLTLETSLVPEADDPELKAFLRDQVRPAVLRHLGEARVLHDQLK